MPPKGSGCDRAFAGAVRTSGHKYANYAVVSGHLRGVGPPSIGPFKGAFPLLEFGRAFGAPLAEHRGPEDSL